MANIRTAAAFWNLIGRRPQELCFKAADLMSNGWTRVHILDEKSVIYWPDGFDQLVSKPSSTTLIQ